MNLTRDDFAISLRSKADTILWEEVRNVIRNLEREKNNPNSEWHWKNSLYYKEFVRRDKIGAYFHAHNKEMFSIDKPNSAILM